MKSDLKKLGIYFIAIAAVNGVIALVVYLKNKSANAEAKD